MIQLTALNPKDVVHVVATARYASKHNEYSDAYFLCRRGHKVFVSTIGMVWNPDRTLNENFEDAGHPSCVYVDPRSGGGVVPVDTLNEIHLITIAEE